MSAVSAPLFPQGAHRTSAIPHPLAGAVSVTSPVLNRCTQIAERERLSTGKTAFLVAHVALATPLAAVTLVVVQTLYLREKPQHHERVAMILNLLSLPKPLTFLTNGIFVAIIAQGLIGISLVWDKILLQRTATKSLPNYVFWLGAMSVLGVLLIPFGFRLPSAGLAALGFGAGVIHLGAVWFYYKALKAGEASQTLAVIGGFSPLATALIGVGLLPQALGGHSVSGFALMVAGGFVMFLSEKFNWRRVLPSVLLSAALFGLTNVLQKVVFNSTGFVTGYVFFTIGTFIAALCLLLPPSWRRDILKQSEEAPPRSKLWYFVNRFISGVGSFLIFYAISRSNPAVVDAISGVRYVIIFVGAYLVTMVKPKWLKEDFHRAALIGKSFATALVVAGLVLVGLGGRQAGGAAGASRLSYPLENRRSSGREECASLDRTSSMRDKSLCGAVGVSGVLRESMFRVFLFALGQCAHRRDWRSELGNQC